MNIVEAYVKFRGQYIILISGFSGSGKTALGEFIAKVFGFEHIKLERFEVSRDEYDKEENYATLKNGIKVLDWDNIDKSIDWDKLNSHINELKAKTGIVITGFGFPISHLKFEPDVHIHLKTSKKTLIEKREKYMEEHPDDPFNKLGPKYQNSMVLTLNTVTYPHYLEFMKASKIDKFINGNELDEDGVKDEAFSYLMHNTKSWHKEHQQSSDEGKPKPSRDVSRPQNSYGQHGQRSNYQQSNYQQSNFQQYNYQPSMHPAYQQPTYLNPAYQQPQYPHPAYQQPTYYQPGEFGPTDNGGIEPGTLPQNLVDQTLKPSGYDEYYHTDRKRYDFNAEGIDYPNTYEQDYGEKDINDYPDVSGSDSDSIDLAYSEIIEGDSEKSGDSESIFLGTFREDN